MSIRLRLNPPRRQAVQKPRRQGQNSKKKRIRRVIMDFKPEVDMDAVEHSLHSIETAVHSILLSRSGPDTLSTSPYPIYQIFEPLENLRLRFAAHTSDIETWGGRSRALEMHNHRVEHRLKDGRPMDAELAAQITSFVRLVPRIDQGYVFSFSRFHRELGQIEGRLTELADFLGSVIHPVPVSDGELIIEPNPALFPYVTGRTVVPAGTPGWMIQLERYGVEKFLTSFIDEAKENVLRKALAKTRVAVSQIYLGRQTCEIEGRRARKMHRLYKKWMRIVNEYDSDSSDFDVELPDVMESADFEFEMPSLIDEDEEGGEGGGGGAKYEVELPSTDEGSADHEIELPDTKAVEFTFEPPSLIEGGAGGAEGAGAGGVEAEYEVELPDTDAAEFAFEPPTVVIEGAAGAEFDAEVDLLLL